MEDDLNLSLSPLAERMRPATLDDFVGQEHLLGQGAVLRKMIESGIMSSFILWGPPGCGKTTLARIIANTLQRDFYTLSAVTSGVKDVREVIAKASSSRMFNVHGAPILFIDEIHRFNKSQQDALLGAVESGTVVLIGATTENPSFEVISPLLSRCRVYVFKSLEVKDLERLLERALHQDEELKRLKINVIEKEALFRFSGGDGRKMLNILELVCMNQVSAPEVIIDNKTVTDILQENIALYDKNGEQHYDIISAFIKSMRGSDPNGAIYWMARMLAGGEDPLFIARRMLILASEDVGLANPNAALLAQSCFDAVHQVGMPEARIILAETCIYLATSPKSNSAYMAIDTALAAVEKGTPLPVPLHLRNAPTSLMKELGYAKDYKYAHDFDGNFVDQEFLPDEISGTRFYEPGENRHEEAIRDRMHKLWGDKYKY
ncbi:MAG: replication-associated recombination protein A [Bacteroidales bacterium]|nr:replication-associated recombination protein A [Bacteroidales bacterium]